jgi:hypothetical protein
LCTLKEPAAPALEGAKPSQIAAPASDRREDEVDGDGRELPPLDAYETEDTPL